MDMFFSFLTPGLAAYTLAIAVLAGLVKGMVGFAMPMILVSGLGTVLPPEVALAGLILPTVVTNGVQALRHGPAAALTSIRRFRVFLVVGGVFLLASAQLVAVLPIPVMLLILGVMITGFTLMQLAGVRFRLSAPSTRIEAAVGAFAGSIGGVSGVWGPPTVAYLTALNTPKADQIRVQGVIYGLGALVLMVAHVASGVLNRETLPFSAALLVPTLLGMWLGGRIHDRIDQQAFRRATLVVLTLAGLNLLRRGLIG
ncbi:MAG: sulfite exporter TauE/SafE family protein [Antarcticimicrobium sp.]|uniref:sulfite exporter TauE/SafE family protein n=1 Tax=Antarcticimicrobium sp. TaxID=2824147 RepID=UPI00261A17A4|nr:sulfite exporter TauE/SafE family protein [Antarcticimicrobium sp.]MDF1718546.1 sulfite exporter TauE/SafE family protein [Antarcticimicrobium sp.]